MPLPGDPAVLTAIGKVLLYKQRPREPLSCSSARRSFSRPTGGANLNSAAALSAIPDLPAAIAAAEQAISLDPLLKDAYVLAAELFKRSGDPKRAAALVRQHADAMRRGSKPQDR